MTEEERKRLHQSMTESQQQADTLRNQYMNRGEFSWDPNADEGFQNYAKLMKQQGNLAMKDTMAKASAMTGGYGNSYAATAGQQMYNQYLGQVDQKANDYYAMALDAFNREGNDLLSKYQMASQNAADAEGRLLEDASIRAQYGDYADYIGMLGISEEAYKSANLTAPTEEHIQGYLDAARLGKGNSYMDYLDGMGVDTDQLLHYAKLKELSGQESGYTVITEKDEDGYEIGVGIKAVEPVKAGEKGSPIQFSTVIDNALNLPKKFENGAKFSVSRTDKDHKSSDNWDLKVGEMVDTSVVPSEVLDEVNKAGRTVFLYNNKAYITDGHNVYQVKANEKKKDEYDAFMAQLRS